MLLLSAGDKPKGVPLWRENATSVVAPWILEQAVDCSIVQIWPARVSRSSYRALDSAIGNQPRNCNCDVDRLGDQWMDERERNRDRITQERDVALGVAADGRAQWR